MYRTEEFNNKTSMKDYMRDYMNGQGFLEYCEKYTGHGSIWSCPLYDFNPAGYGKNYKYFYIIGKKVIFDRIAEERAKEKEKTMERYINQVCRKEKVILSEKIQALEGKYPGSVALSAGSCHVCSKCKTPESGECRYSEDIRYFIESLGGSVGETAGDLLGIELQWMKQRLPESFTLISGFLTDNPTVEI